MKVNGYTNADFKVDIDPNDYRGCLEGCAPIQILNFNYAFNIEDIGNLAVYDEDGCPYDLTTGEWAYSIDNVCWSCYMAYDDMLAALTQMNADVYVRMKVAGGISKVQICCVDFTDYSTMLYSGFSLSACGSSTNISASQPITHPNTWNPYANLDNAISLQQQMTENVACMFGVPIYYFKLAPNMGSRDITFKEYALMDVEAVKQIKLIITDGQMPSSRPEFSDFGLDWQTDWETEISKGMFATAFGVNAQPMEGDLIYIPMMKRMWMVNGSWEEKRDALMWNATTFKVTLVKYQEKASVNLGNTEDLVSSFVKNKYDDLFGDQENIDSGIECTEPVEYVPDNLFPIFESDSTRKYIGINGVNIIDESTYYKGTLISDETYEFNTVESSVTYQRKYCGNEGALSFVITPGGGTYKGVLLSLGNIQINISQNISNTILSVTDKNVIKLTAGNTYFIYLRWSQQLNVVEFSVARYMHPNMPLYKLQPHHFWFEIDSLYKKTVSTFDIEFVQETKTDVILHNFIGKITNIKLFDVYNDNISEMLQMYPTHQHLIINDTARKILQLNGHVR